MSAIEKLKEYGPPEEWSGAVAGVLGDKGRADLETEWLKLSKEEQDDIKAAWEKKMDGVLNKAERSNHMSVDELQKMSESVLGDGKNYDGPITCPHCKKTYHPRDGSAPNGEPLGDRATCRFCKKPIDEPTSRTKESMMGEVMGGWNSSAAGRCSKLAAMLGLDVKYAQSQNYDVEMTITGDPKQKQKFIDAVEKELNAEAGKEVGGRVGFNFV